MKPFKESKLSDTLMLMCVANIIQVQNIENEIAGEFHNKEKIDVIVVEKVSSIIISQSKL